MKNQKRDRYGQFAGKVLRENPYVAICTCCDSTFRSIEQAFNHANRTDHDFTITGENR
jgi:hypothetical protein